MAISQGGGTPARQQVTAGQDAYVAGRDKDFPNAHSSGYVRASIMDRCHTK
jgi:hypothetical protein